MLCWKSDLLGLSLRVTEGAKQAFKFVPFFLRKRVASDKAIYQRRCLLLSLFLSSPSEGKLSSYWNMQYRLREEDLGYVYDDTFYEFHTVSSRPIKSIDTVGCSFTWTALHHPLIEFTSVPSVFRNFRNFRGGLEKQHQSTTLLLASFCRRWTSFTDASSSIAVQCWLDQVRQIALCFASTVSSNVIVGKIKGFAIHCIYQGWLTCVREFSPLGNGSPRTDSMLSDQFWPHSYFHQPYGGAVSPPLPTPTVAHRPPSGCPYAMTTVLTCCQSRRPCRDRTSAQVPYACRFTVAVSFGR